MFWRGFQIGLGIATGLCAIYLLICALILLAEWARELRERP